MNDVFKMQLLHEGLILLGKQLIKGTYERINPEVFEIEKKSKDPHICNENGFNTFSCPCEVNIASSTKLLILPLRAVGLLPEQIQQKKKN